MLKVLMRRLLPPFAMLACGACVAAPPLVTTRAACSSLLPAEWAQGVAGVELPAGDTVGDWIAFADAQTGRLDVANDRYKAAVGIVARCEERDRAAVQPPRRKVLGLF